MPELFSRMDNLNWLTPSIADILDQGSTPPGGDGSIRERMLTIQRELDELDTPARIINVRSTPSYTLYTARLGSIGRMGNRRTITSKEIKNSIKQIAENHPDWLLGFIPQLRDDDSAVGILLRTDDHRPLSLRRLLVRGAFRKHPSTLAFVLGITLEQQLIVDSIDGMGHLLVVGSENAKQHFIRGTLLTLIMLNTPSELRIAITGESSDAYKYLVGAPHALGRILTSPKEGQRLVDGLVKEIQRREQSLQDKEVPNIGEYNTIANQTGISILPRIVLILDSLTDDTWRTESKNWEKSLSELLVKGERVGIHLIITVDDEDNLNLPDSIIQDITYKVVTRASSKDISANIPSFHASLLRFVDAFIIGKNIKPEDVIPVELCAISNSEIKNVVEYWRQMSKKRYQDTQATKTSQKTGVTGLLTPPPELEEREVTPPTPPKPEKPSASTLSRATQILGTQIANTVKAETQATTQQAVATIEVEEQPEEVMEPPIQEETQILEEPEALETQTAPNIASPTEEEKSPHKDYAEYVQDQSTLIQQAIALSAYLGWISKGALSDIFNISTKEADQIIEELQKQSVIENTDNPILRFIKVGQSTNGVYH